MKHTLMLIALSGALIAPADADQHGDRKSVV